MTFKLKTVLTSLSVFIFSVGTIAGAFAAGEGGMAQESSHDHAHEKNASQVPVAAHNEAEHEKSGHEEAGHNEAGHEKNGHEEAGHNEAEHDEEGHDESGHGHDESGGGEVTLSEQQIKLAGIEVAAINAEVIEYQLYAPGEVKANGYTSYLVSPRVDSVVLRRHVGLGDHVEKGQALVTLFSETVAEAQANFRVASSEWRRIQRLGKKSVGDKRYITGQSNYDAALGRLQAYGLSKTAINSLAKSAQPLGEYTLSAISTGAILSDDFQQGQRVESGEALMVVADEHTLWIEARLPANTQLDLPVGTLAQVKVGDNYFTAKVTQEAHTIDLVTRTRIVRLEVENENHLLHSGMFADVYFSLSSLTPVLTVPETALMRSSDGDWVVFIEEQPQVFEMQEVELGRSFTNDSGKWREIKGLVANSRIVIKGAFFVASEQAKGGFDPHNH